MVDTDADVESGLKGKVCIGREGIAMDSVHVDSVARCYGTGRTVMISMGTITGLSRKQEAHDTIIAAFSEADLEGRRS